MRQVFVEELVDAALVELLDTQATQRHPMSEVRDAGEAAPHGALRVLAAPEARDVGRHVRGQRALGQPDSHGRVQTRGSRTWRSPEVETQCCPGRRLMSSSARSSLFHHQTPGGFRDTWFKRLCITGHCA
jgi:hypothetical protein